MVNLTLAKKSSKSQAYGLSQMTNPPTPDEFLQIRRCWGWSENGGKLAFGEHYEQVKNRKVTRQFLHHIILSCCRWIAFKGNPKIISKLFSLNQ